jgi:hypothetical protein
MNYFLKQTLSSFQIFKQYYWTHEYFKLFLNLFIGYKARSTINQKIKLHYIQSSTTFDTKKERKIVFEIKGYKIIWITIDLKDLFLLHIFCSDH